MKYCRLILLLFLIAAETASALPARVILLRHAEKPPDESDIHLSERGESRARALVVLLATERVLGTNGPPAALFAPKVTRRGHSRRPYETLEPLAEHLKLSIQTPYGPSDYAALAKHILSDPGLDGKTVVVCWIHDYLPALAKALGLKPEPARWKGSVYDRVWVITYADHRPVLANLPQNLLPGDSTE
ncbi:MAG: histidine phosphatase family protein [Limisphaerales bacterium]